MKLLLQREIKLFTPNESFSILPLIIVTTCLLILSISSFLSKKKENKSSAKFEIINCIVILLGTILSLIAKNYIFQSIAVIIFSALKLLAKQDDQKTAEAIQEAAMKAALENENTQPAVDLEAEAEKAKEAEIVSLGRDFMIEASEAFSDSDGLSRLLSSINKSVIKTVQADGGAILLVDEFDDIITVKSFEGTFPPPYQLPQDLPHKIARIETSFRFAQFPLGETIFGITATTGKAELITDPLNDERIVQNEPEEFLKLGTYIIIPMIVKESVIGILALARKADSPKFDEKDFARAQSLAQFASGAIQNVFSFQEIAEHAELTRESEIACKLQKSIHAKNNFSIPNATFGCFFNGAEGVCGDYFDVIPCRKDRISFILADVAGKGMNSLIVMVMIRAIMQLVVNTQKTAATILNWTNRGITGKINIDHFASLILANYDSENMIFQFAAAGNAPALIYHSETKEIETIQTASDPIGVDKSTEYKDIEVHVNSGDIIVLYTDGLVEAVDGNSRQCGVERIKQLVVENSSLKASDISTKIKKNLKEFCGTARQHDDQTLMVIKVQ